MSQFPLQPIVNVGIFSRCGDCRKTLWVEHPGLMFEVAYGSDALDVCVCGKACIPVIVCAAHSVLPTRPSVLRKRCLSIGVGEQLRNGTRAMMATQVTPRNGRIVNVSLARAKIATNALHRQQRCGGGNGKSLSKIRSKNNSRRSCLCFI